MKLQVRCQLPFETQHCSNPGKTRPALELEQMEKKKKRKKERMTELKGSGRGVEI